MFACCHLPCPGAPRARPGKTGLRYKGWVREGKRQREAGKHALSRRGHFCSQAEAASEGFPSLGHVPRVPLTWLEKRSVFCRRSRSPFPGPSQNSRPMVTLSGLLSNRSPSLSMVTLRLWAKPCPEHPGDAHRGPGVATGGGCPSVLRIS